MFFAYTGTFTFSPALPSTVPISIWIASDEEGSVGVGLTVGSGDLLAVGSGDVVPP